MHNSVNYSLFLCISLVDKKDLIGKYFNKFGK
jgi:hypothetical protein